MPKPGPTPFVAAASGASCWRSALDNMDLLQFGEAQAGVQEARIDLAALYDAPARRQFEERWPSFFASDPAHPAIFDKSGDLLRYRTLHFVPNVSDERPPLLFLMGNPASHSA